MAKHLASAAAWAALLAGCSQPGAKPSPPPGPAPAVESRLANDEARIATLEQRLNALEAPAHAPVQTATRSPGLTLTVTTVAEDLPASTMHKRFRSHAECEAARKKALADAAANAQSAGQTHVEQLSNGAALITPARSPPRVTAGCSG